MRHLKITNREIKMNILPSTNLKNQSKKKSFMKII